MSQSIHLQKLVLDGREGVHYRLKPPSRIFPNDLQRYLDHCEPLLPLALLDQCRDTLEIGTKKSLAAEINNITRIPEGILVNVQENLEDIPVAARMSWAATRVTTRREDMAYCLMGIFDVNMPLLYGEEEKAFRRLQEEIIKQSQDMSIFAWVDHGDYEFTDDYSGLLATFPAQFSNCSNMATTETPNLGDEEFSITNQMVRYNGWVYRDDASGLTIVPIRHCSIQPSHQYDPELGLFLRQLGPDLYVRAWPRKLHEFDHLFSAAPQKFKISARIPKYLAQHQRRKARESHLTVNQSLSLGQISYRLDYVDLFGVWDPSTSTNSPGVCWKFCRHTVVPWFYRWVRP